MTPKTLNIITGILIGGTILYLFIILIIAQIKYSIVLDYIRKIKPNYRESLSGLWVADNGGKWIAGTYYFRTPLPLYIDTKNLELKKLIDKHNLIIKIFWISAITVLPAVIILLNVIND
jgi:hypothetical protein